MGTTIRKTLNRISNPYWRAKYKYIKYVDKMPIDDKMILLESQHGKEFNGNIFSMAKYLCSAEEYKEYKVYLSAAKSRVNSFKKKAEEYGIKNLNFVILSTKEYFKVLASAKYLVNDNTFLPFFIKREGQIYLNTWHGTPLKCLGRKIKNDAVNIGNPQRNFVSADWLLYPNDYTKEHIIEDYMLANMSNSKIIMGGYPRNDIFFNEKRRTELRQSLGLENKKVYAYMPTFRGTAREGTSEQSEDYMLKSLYALDKELNDNEVLYLNLHPVSQSTVNFGDFKNIKPFPSNLDTYDFLNIADCLVSDYSSVFFDFACTKKKIILFTFDKEEYLRDRGLYISLDELPYPQVSDYKALLDEMRAEKNYDDTEFLQKFCPYDNINSSKQLCDQIILGKDCGLKTESMPNNGKENVLIFAGNLAPNGVTASLRNLLTILDKSERNYYINFRQTAADQYSDNMLSLTQNGVSYYATKNEFNLTVGNLACKLLFRLKLMNVKTYMFFCHKRVKQNFDKEFGATNFSTYIQFSGYAADPILKFMQTEKNSIIYVHSDMLKEIKQRGNQRADVLRYAYSHYNKVAVVTQDIIPPTEKLGGGDRICVAKNAIPYKTIAEKAELTPRLDETTQCSLSHEDAMKFLLDKSTKKFITVGRFSPEKGHDRLVNAFENFAKNHEDARLVILGGSSYDDHYEKLLKLITDKHLTDRVLLIMDVSNPYAIIKLCDSFVLSSYYEGFGLVLAEADIVGLPVISTNITGPRGFMNKYGGTMVDNSQGGIEEGLKLLYDGKVPMLKTDYEQYNNEVIDEFMNLLKQ